MSDAFLDDDDLIDIDTPCPNKAPETRTKPCTVFGCEEGQVDEHEDDPINYAPGEAYSECSECHGFGHHPLVPEVQVRHELEAGGQMIIRWR